MTISIWRFPAVLLAGVSIGLGAGMTSIALQDPPAIDPVIPSPAPQELPPRVLPSDGTSSTGSLSSDPLFQEIQQRVGKVPKLIDEPVTSPFASMETTGVQSVQHREVYLATEAMLRAARLLEVELAGIEKDGEPRLQKDAGSAEVSRDRKLREIIVRLRRDARQVLVDLHE
jgi:hypothetical protein